jgi:hypothetical protein
MLRIRAQEETTMKDVIEFFTGANAWAWLFIIVAGVVLTAIAQHQKGGATLGQDDPQA